MYLILYSQKIVLTRALSNKLDVMRLGQAKPHCWVHIAIITIQIMEQLRLKIEYKVKQQFH